LQLIVIQLDFGMTKKNHQKKTPADYPQMIFRISQADKDRISELVENVTRLHNDTRLPHMKKIRKNEMIVTALFFGLLRMEKGLGKLPKTSSNKV
jgi:hypothetical protein